jgi:hypothetical protein
MLPGGLNQFSQILELCLYSHDETWPLALAVRRDVSDGARSGCGGAAGDLVDGLPGDSDALPGDGCTARDGCPEGRRMHCQGRSVSVMSIELDCHRMAGPGKK